MRILIVSQYFFPEDFKVNDVAFDFAKKGHQVTVLTAKPNYPKGKFYSGYGMFSKRKEKINGVSVIRTPVFPRKSGGAIFLTMNYISFVFFSFYACLFRITGKYDIVFAHLTSPITAALPAIWLKRKFRIPLVLWILDLWPESIMATTKISNRHIYGLLNRLVSYIYRSANTILVSSNFFKKSIQEKLGSHSVPIAYFPNWAESIFTNLERIDYRLPNFPKGFKIMFAGNIGDAQDFESILNAVELTQDKSINWVIVGDGRKKDWLKAEILKRKLSNIYLMGRHPLETMPIFFEQADAMLVSLKDEPIFRLTVPAKIQAYMASKKIILGMINGEGNELIKKSGCGYVVGAGDYMGLSDKAVAISKMSIDARKKMEGNAMKYYQENFTKEFLLSKLTGIFNKLMQTAILL